jgi:GT2 family glycosyltransferase
MTLLRLLAALATAVLLPPLLLLNAASLALLDLLQALSARRGARPGSPGWPAGQEARSQVPASLSVVIPSWNARDLLEKFLPSVVQAAAFHPDNEVIVVDNASDDGTAELLAARFPEVRALRMPTNLGFGGGNNAGVRAARNRIVVVLNNDMRVEPEAFQRLLEGFQDDRVFAVSAQIFFLDRARRREETGLTEGLFVEGFFRFRHAAEELSGLYPTFYAGGGSSAYDRDKFLELGGFDPLYHPFYVEDADLSYNAWKRGWKVLYQPRAVVHHEHRGTIGRRFSPAAIDAILKKNLVLMVWKNVHCWKWLAEHFFFLYVNLVLSALFGGSPTRITPGGYLRALGGWPRALGGRWRARRRAVIPDAEAVLRPQPAYYRDRFLPATPAEGRPLRILFLAPYSLYPPTHGGAVFMYQTVRALAARHQLHVLAFVDRPEELESNRELERHAASVECVLRNFPPRRDLLGLLPYSVRCFIDPEFQRRVQRLIWERDIDLVQVEYTQLGQFAGGWRQTPTVLFEHDIYFQSVWRAIRRSGSVGEFAHTVVEWLRALRYELRLLARMDLVQTCSEKQARLLESFLGCGRAAINGVLRTAIDTAAYTPVFSGREPETLLFVGNFRHAPNLGGLRFLVDKVMPRLRAERPNVELIVVGAYPTPEVQMLCARPGVRLLGMVPEIREVLARYALFVSPIFTGSGVRVKILEAFAAGIPVISTSLGAEGLDVTDGLELLLAGDQREFVSAIIDLLEHPDRAEAVARRARHTVEQRWDMGVVLERLEEAYRELLRRGRPPGQRAVWCAK